MTSTREEPLAAIEPDCLNERYNICFYDGSIATDDGIIEFRRNLLAMCAAMGIDNGMHLWSNIASAKAIRGLSTSSASHCENYIKSRIPGPGIMTTSYTIPTPKPFVITKNETDTCYTPSKTSGTGKKFIPGTFTGQVRLVLTNPKWTPMIKSTLFEGDEGQCTAVLAVVDLVRMKKNTDESDDVQEEKPLSRALSMAKSTLRKYTAEFRRIFTLDNIQE